MNIMRIGLDLAKNVFELYGVDENERGSLSKTVRPNKVLARFAQLAPQFVAPYRRNDKNDRNDASAICEAVSRPTMRFVPIKDAERQAALTAHRARSLLISERTALVNHIRGLLREYRIATT